MPRKSVKAQDKLVYDDLMGYLSKIPDTSPIFVEGLTKFSLPRVKKDGRKASWEHVIRNLSKSVISRTSRDCYIATFKDDKGSAYAAHKFGNNNVHVHRTAAVLSFPDRVQDISRAEDLGEEKLPNNVFVVAHRCGTAKCFNPRHVVVVTQLVNEDHKGCRYGSKALCPHRPKCIFVRNGRFLPCLNMVNTPAKCSLITPVVSTSALIVSARSLSPREQSNISDILMA
jgi:hypothetical protein